VAFSPWHQGGDRTIVAMGVGSMSDHGISGNMQESTALDAALQAMFAQLVDSALGSQALTKDGKPLRDVCYMHLPQGLPVDPREYANPWSPAGGATIADESNLGQVSTPPSTTSGSSSTGSGATTPAGPSQAQLQLQASMNAAFQTARLVDLRMLVTTDGQYQPYQGSELISDAYQGVILRAQGIPADPPPADIQAKIDAARATLWILKPDGSTTGRKTPEYQAYEQLASAWASARSSYAVAEAGAVKDPDLGAAWPVTSSSLKTTVDNAWNDWRSAGADQIENALDTLGSVGGSIGAFYVAQAREVFKAWDLGLTGSVPVGTPYSMVSPTTWYDPTDEQNGFTQITVTSSTSSASSSETASSMANSWYSGHSETVGGGGAAMIFGVTIGADASHSDASQSQGSSASGGTTSRFSAQMSDVTISYEYGLCRIDRPYMLSELFIIDGWYLPGEPKDRVSDGTVSGTVQGQTADAQNSDGPETHLLPMVTTQFLVVRNVSITATGWGEAGDAMSQWCTSQQSQSQSSSNTASGGVGFLCFGGYVSDTNADWSGSDSGSYAASRSWNFSTSGESGTLKINGCQIAGWIGEILPASPRVDGTQKATSGSGGSSAGSSSSTAGSDSASSGQSASTSATAPSS
jgi:hypothetical protein